MNVTAPDIRGPINSIVNQTGTVQCVRQDQYVIVATAGSNDERGVVQAMTEAISCDPLNNPGSVLWKTLYNPH